MPSKRRRVGRYSVREATAEVRKAMDRSVPILETLDDLEPEMAQLRAHLAASPDTAP